jgi:hypothetical protein
MKTATIAAIALAVAGAWTAPAWAHCDTLDGPVVAAAREALRTGQVEHALVWVQKDGEPGVRQAFAKARTARATGADAPADRAFYATLVKVHREGEGEKFTGLKPAGSIDPAVRMADEALAGGSPDRLEKAVADHVVRSIHERYERASALRDFPPTDVEAGRRYVGAYVQYVHHVEKVHATAAAGDHAHGPAKAPAGDAAGTKPLHAH